MRKTRAGAVVGFMVAVGIVVSGCASDQPAADDAPSQTPETASEESAAPEKSFEQLVDETKIEAGLSVEDYAQAFHSRLDLWALAGANDETLRGWLDADDVVLFEDDLAAAQSAVFTSALFGPDYQSEPSLVNNEANLTTRNAAWLALWFRSQGTLELGSVIEQATIVSEDPTIGERVVYIAGHDTNNGEDADFANPDTQQKTVDKIGDTWDHTLTLRVIDGYEYVVKWED